MWLLSAYPITEGKKFAKNIICQEKMKKLSGSQSFQKSTFFYSFRYYFVLTWSNAGK